MTGQERLGAEFYDSSPEQGELFAVQPATVPPAAPVRLCVACGGYCRDDATICRACDNAGVTAPALF